MDYYRNLDASVLDPDFPTIFELLASKQLEELINPYLRYIIVHYAQRHPQYLLKLATKFDEIYLILFGLVEFGYLRHWNASFVEKFYGLKRVNRLPVPATRTTKNAPNKIDALRRLTRGQVFGSLFFAVGVPYLREKIQQRYEVLVANFTLRDIKEAQPKEDAPLLEHWKFQFDCFLLQWYPRSRFIVNSVELLLAASYLFNGTGPYSIADLVLNMRCSRISKGDYEWHESVLTKGRFKTFKRALGGLGYVLPATLFGIKFLEWWNSSELTSKLSNNQAELPPPSSIVTKSNKENNEYKWTGCPICKSTKPDTPTILETGIICCYQCIKSYARSLPSNSEPKCPATNIKLLHATYNKELQVWEIGGLRRLIL